MNRYSQTKRWRVKTDEQKYLLLFGDIVVSAISLFVALYLWAAGDLWLKHFSIEFLKVRVPIWFYCLPLLWLLLMMELYDPRRANRKRDILIGIGVAALICGIIYLVIFFISRDPNSLPRKGVAIFIVLNTVLTIVWRMLYIRIFTAPSFMRRMLIIGAGKSGTALIEVIKEMWPQPFYLVGLIDDDPSKIGESVLGYPVLGGSDQLLQLVDKENISDMILAISGAMNGTMFQAILDCQEKGIEINTMPKIYEELLGRVPIFFLETDWIIRSFVDQARASIFYEFEKRLMDIIGGLVGCIFLVLFLPLCSLAIVLDSGFPVFFLQQRVGHGGRTYNIIKFRTMNQDAEKDGVVRVTTENDSRITRVGWFLRRSHLDEWPQFFNVLRGEMSLVGPRAERSELVQQLQEKVPFYRARLLIKPGLTGWAQINFKYAASVEDTAVKLEYDLYYIKHRSFFMDISILARTVWSVIGFKGQ